MKIQFKYKGSHTCEAMVITCMDFRFWEAVVEYARKDLGVESFDFPNLPGVSKAINEAKEGELPLQCVDISCNLHKADKLILVDHADCGAYGGSARFKSSQEEQLFHEEALRKSRDIIRKKYPQKEIILVYAKLVDDNNMIEFIKVA